MLIAELSSIMQNPPATFQIVASDLRVGVNHLALDEERIRQEQFFEGILDLQQRISQNPDYQERYSDEVEDLKNKIRLNADALSYLKSITKLELPLTDLTNKITQAAIDAASPSSASSSVFANKFHHMANEVDAHIDKMIEMAETKMIRFDPQGTVDESIMLAKELE
ncbi:unnamed protein product, partial [Hydatigera taeniaeformis]|uniref:Tubulin-specific chaperone A n=1 Tax=Hydatigena taeniaeformis TaxID=6205 RepID=A0A0R3X9P6_HYDTA